MTGMRKRLFRMLTLMLCVLLLCSQIAEPVQAVLRTRTLTLEQAQRMALAASPEITKQKNAITLKRMKYVEAVEGIRAKVKNLTSFRWSPLLSFKFPQQLVMQQEFELNIKPLTLQSEIDTMVHRLDDLQYEITHKVTGQFYDVYLLQETTAFIQARLDDAKEQLKRNSAQLKTGKATQTDVDRAKSAVDELTSNLAGRMREYETAKEKLSKTINMDISTGYKFANGFKAAVIPREQLESLTQYTLEHDQAFYEVKAQTAVATMNLNAYESLMRDEYGSKLNYIQNYINMAKQGMDVDYSAYQMQYREMLSAIDRPWAGRIKIWFIRFSKEFLKGEIDGTRYIEDEMYAIYTACMDYGNAVKEQTTMEKDLRQQVRDSYEGIVTAWNTYESLQALVAEASETLEKVRALNRLGKATYTEVADEQTAYQDAQQDALDGLADYNHMLSEFNRLTCGAVNKYMKNAGMGLDTGESGDAFAILDPISDPYYYIYTSVADLTFYFGVSIPENYEPAVDSFEIWYDGTQIGERTDVGTELRHLALDYQDTGTLLVRLYQGDTFVDECEISTAVPRDKLDIALEKVEAEDRVIGTYSVNTTLQGNVSVSELKLRINAAENASSYTLSYGEGGIYTSDPRSTNDSFIYLTLLISSLEDVTLNLFNGEGDLVVQATFDPSTQEIIIPVSNE